MTRRYSFVNYLLSFCIPAAIILAALTGLKVTPFGNNSLTMSDGNALYINYMGYFSRAINGQADLFYSFEKGIGGNMMGSWGWFLLNPFFVLFAVTDITNYMNTYTYVSLLNFCLCGLTMYVLLKDIYGHRLSNLIFSTSYALNGFLVANVFQLNFFTGVATLPLVALGLKRIVSDRSPLIYILSLAYSLLTNFYFGFMLCVASVLIFFTFFFSCLYKDRKAILFKYCFSSLLAGTVSSVVWLPAVLSLRGGRLNQSIIDKFTFKENMPLLDIFSKLFTGANSTAELRDGLPNIFVGILPVALVILFFISNNIPHNKKKIAAFLLCTYIISFYIIVFNIAMHGGTVTNWFNFRDSFIFSFLLIMIAAEEWQYITQEPSKTIIRALIILLVGVFAIFSKSYEYVTGSEMLIDLLILSIIIFALRIHKKDSQNNPKRTFEMVVLLLVSVNLFLNYNFCTKKIMSWTNSETEFQQIVFPISTIVDAVKQSDKEFYRMEIDDQRTKTCGNDPMLYGYYGVGHGGSDERDFVRMTMNQLGINRFDMRTYYSKGVSSATDCLLGLKYIISKENLNKIKGYESLINLDGITLYKNLNALPIVTLPDKKMEKIQYDFNNVFENLNKTWSAISGIQDKVFLEEENVIFTSHNITDSLTLSQKEASSIVESRDRLAEKNSLITSESSVSNESSEINDQINASENLKETEGILKEKPNKLNYIKYTWTASRDGAVYSYNRSGITENHGSILAALNFEGYHQKGDEVTSYLPVTNSMVTEDLTEEVAGRYKIAYVDNDTLEKMCQIILGRSTRIERITDSHLKGEFTAKKGQTLMFTIPYDEGWSLSIDGKKIALRQVLGMFMAADVEPGEHSYEMKYVPPGFRIGVLAAGISLVLIACYLYLDSRNRKKAGSILLEESAGQTIDSDTGIEEIVEYTTEKKDQTT